MTAKITLTKLPLFVLIQPQRSYFSNTDTSKKEKHVVLDRNESISSLSEEACNSPSKLIKVKCRSGCDELPIGNDVLPFVVKIIKKEYNFQIGPQVFESKTTGNIFT